MIFESENGGEILRLEDLGRLKVIKKVVEWEVNFMKFDLECSECGALSLSCANGIKIFR